MTNCGPVDDVLSLTSDSRRRQVLYCLLSNERTDLQSLALQIAAWERDETIASVERDASQSVEISLHHNHLPKLAEIGVVEYDARAGDVVRGDRFADVESVVDELRAVEDRGGDADATGAAPTTDEPRYPSP